MTYRREIDGLRSIAVLSVVLFHFGMPGVSGGFVGVDVFFVISGFLIGGILWGELASQGRISFSRFYMRRIKRLAPAYVAMALVSLAFAWLILLPFEFREFGKSLIAATVYLSNILFFRQSGYFDSGADEKLLLHTWSLSVEEQFYIFLPLLLLLLGRRKTGLFVALIALFWASLLASIYTTFSNHSAAFYLFPFRAWELLSGVLLAIYGRQTACKWAVAPWVSWLGMALVLGGIIWIEEGAQFPGYQVIFPVLGTVLLLLNGKGDNLINRAPVGIGLISYSLYLWHWPVFVLSTYYRDTYSGPLEALLWVGGSFGLAWLSWRFVERPFRQSQSSAAGVFAGAAVASLLLIGLGAVLYKKDGLPQRFGPEAAIHIQASADFLQDWRRCHVPQQGDFAGIEICPIGPENQKPQVVIWGDSHLRAFKEGIAQIARKQGVAGLIIWHAGCPPLFDVSKQESAATPQQDAACTAANQKIRTALPRLGIDRLLLVGRWNYYAQGAGIGLDAQNKITLSTDFATALQHTIAELSTSFDQIYVLRQAPEITGYDSRIIARQLAHGKLAPGADLEALQSIARADLDARTQPANQALVGLDVTLIDPWPLLCDARFCHAVQNGLGYYFDNNHLTNTGARQLRHIFAPVFAPLPRGTND